MLSRNEQRGIIKVREIQRNCGAIVHSTNSDSFNIRGEWVLMDPIKKFLLAVFQGILASIVSNSVVDAVKREALESKIKKLHSMFRRNLISSLESAKVEISFKNEIEKVLTDEMLLRIDADIIHQKDAVLDNIRKALHNLLNSEIDNSESIVSAIELSVKRFYEEMSADPDLKQYVDSNAAYQYISDIRGMILATRKKFLGSDPGTEETEYVTKYVANSDCPQTLEALIDQYKGQVLWIQGVHGAGKTIYMRKLFRHERWGQRTTSFQLYVWVNYANSLKNSIRASLADDKIPLSCLEKERCVLFIDNVEDDIQGELTALTVKNPDLWCLVTSTRKSNDNTIYLGPNLDQAKAIFISTSDVRKEDTLIDDIIALSAGIPFIANLLGIQAKNYLKRGIGMKKLLEDLREDGFENGFDDEENIAKRTAMLYRSDYEKLSDEEKRVLHSFVFLDKTGGDHAIKPKAIGWCCDRQDIFEKLCDIGFIMNVDIGEYSMHDIMIAAVKRICRESNHVLCYDDVKDLIFALGNYIDRENQYDRDMMALYKEVYMAYSIFLNLSGEEYDRKAQLEDFEVKGDYAWMVNNVFSAFDDYGIKEANKGSKYAARLCEAAERRGDLSKYRLAVSYNSAGYVPSAYQYLCTDLERMQYYTENISYLLKARVILDELSGEGDAELRTLKAKLFSNIGAVWQRLHIMLAAKNAIDRAVDEHTQALKIREDLLKEAGLEDIRREEWQVMIARSRFTLATDYYYKGDLSEAIERHMQAIEGYESIEGAKEGKYDTYLFTSYSRKANAEREYALKSGDPMLVTAYNDFTTAFTYLNNLEIAKTKASLGFYESYLKTAFEISNKKTIHINGLEERISLIIKTIQETYQREKDMVGLAVFNNEYPLWAISHNEK